MRFQRCARGLAGLAGALILAGGARSEPVALTFDDLPSMTLIEDPAYAEVTTTRLLRGLRRNHLPAIGFVTGQQLDGPRREAGEHMLQQWLRQGIPLGNHTWSHESLNKIPLDTYIADVKRDDDLLRPLLAPWGRSPHWFRHPFLDTGATLEEKQKFEAWLKQAGYRVAPVTMENSDYLFSPSYDDALRRHDLKAAAKVRRDYLDYTAKVTTWYRAAGLQLFGRRPAHVYLMHATRLNADSIDALAKILRANHLRPVTLEQAMKDPVYARADDYADPDGDEWISRWSHEMGRELSWDDFPEPPADIAAAAERLDPT